MWSIEHFLENEKTAEALDKETAMIFSGVRDLARFKAEWILRRTEELWKWDYQKLRDADIELLVGIEMSEGELTNLPTRWGQKELVEAFLEKFGPPTEWHDYFARYDPEGESSIRDLTSADCWIVVAHSLAIAAYHHLCGASVTYGWSVQDALRNGAWHLADASASLVRAEHLYAAEESRSALTRKAARFRHVKTYDVRAKAIRLYEAGTWKSRLDAANKIFPEVAAYALSLGMRMSQERGTRTIYEWLSNHSKTTRLRGDG